MISEKNFLENYFYILKGKRPQLFFMAALFLISSILELLGIGLVGSFVGAVINPNFLNQFTTLNSVINSFGKPEPINQIIILGTFLLFVFLIKGGLSYWIYYHICKFTFNLRAGLVQKLMCAYIEMPYQFYLERNSAAMVNSIIAHTKTATDDLVLPSLRIISDTFILLAITLFLFWINPIAMLILLFSLGAVSLPYIFIVKPIVKRAGQNVAVQKEELIKGVNQIIGAIKEIRILSSEKNFLEYVKSASCSLASGELEFYSLLGLPRFLLEVIFVSFVILFTLFTLYLGKSGEHMIATLAIFSFAGIRALPAVANISSSLTSINYSRFVLSQLYFDLKEVEKVEPKSSVRFPASKKAHKNFESLILKDIKFSYPNSRHPVLNKISFNLSRGKSIGLIGPSGSGKTTFVDVLLGLHQFHSGSFIINGRDISDYSWNLWLSQIAYIPQNIFLTDETLAKNIAFGIPEHKIDFTKIKKAIKSAQLNKLVSTLPNGVQTLVGDRGIRLSGGERQRVALARAFYHNRNIFILDEATSSLDAETESLIIDVIESLRGHKTLIVIAHRLSTVKNCDLICRLKNGRIVEVGRFKDITNAA
jgi:ABC-type multidrug transport system fused ATPase/permease subunit